MNGYTKLFGSIVASTIWREDDKTRIVWVTMLAMANKYGDVEAAVPGLADLARVSIADVEKALETLQKPDKHSRTKDYEGRRIEAVDGGWHILNHAKYRDKMSKDERRNYLARKQAERRARLKAEACRVNNESTNVAIGQQASTPVNVGRDIAEADSYAFERESTGDGSEWEERIIAAYPRKDAPMDCAAALSVALAGGEEPELILQAVREIAALCNGAPGGISNRYIPKAKTFFTEAQWRSPEAFRERWKPKPDATKTPQRRDSGNLNRDDRYK